MVFSSSRRPDSPTPLPLSLTLRSSSKQPSSPPLVTPPDVLSRTPYRRSQPSRMIFCLRK